MSLTSAVEVSAHVSVPLIVRSITNVFESGSDDGGGEEPTVGGGGEVFVMGEGRQWRVALGAVGEGLQLEIEFF